MKKDRTYYKLTNSQVSVRMFLFFSAHTQVMSVPLAAYIDAKLDMEALKKAVYIEIERNDALRISFKYGKLGWKQSFLPVGESSGTVEILDFSDLTEYEMEKYLGEDARRELDFKGGELYRIKIFRMPGGERTGFYINSFHMINDAYGCHRLFEDIIAVYEALVRGEEIPPQLDSFEEKIKGELTKNNYEIISRQKEIFEKNQREIKTRSMLISPGGPEKLDRAIKKGKTRFKVKNKNEDETRNYNESVPSEISEKLTEYLKKTGASPSALFILAYRTYCCAVNRRSKYFHLMLVSNRRKTKKDKNMSGNLMQLVFLTSELEESASFAEATSYITGRMFGCYRTTELGAMEQLSIGKRVFGKKYFGNNLIYYSFLGMPGTVSGKKYRVTGFSSGYFPVPLYIFNIANQTYGSYTCRYEYRTAWFEEWNIKEMHENAMRIIEAGIEDPTVTVGELMDLVKSRHISK